MIRRIAAVFIGLSVVLLTGAEPAVAQVATAGEEQDVEVTADQLEYEADKKLLTGRGNVVVKHGPDELRADYVSVRTDTQEAHAIGNVVYEREGKVWRGDEIRYNFKTRQGDFGEFTAYVNPYYVSAEESKRVTSKEFVLRNAIITTCEGPRPEYKIRAREARIVGDESLTARGVVVYLGPVPIFYLPKWTKHLGGDGMDIDFVPGYSSRMGAYLLTACNYRLGPALKGTTHLDYRTQRGVGVGQDFTWGDPRLPYHGTIRGYYANDDSPLEGRSDSEINEYGDLIDSDRYRVRLSDVRYFSDRDYMITELNYLSDPAVIEDFFNREFRDNQQPENRISLTHRDDYFTAGLLVNKRLNDFYENVDRVPEALLDVSRMRIGETPLFYESGNSASWLEKVFPENSGVDSYDAFRIDSGHMVLWPTRHFGFLNTIPRAGYRGTYYSTTYEDETVTNVISSVDSNGIASVTNEVVTTQLDKGAEIRNLFELGFETSFKAFGVWHEDPIGRDYRGLRHVVEPYANYTFVPEPDLLPENLPQFDNVDRLGKRNDVLLGVRNKLQTKRKGRVHDFVNLDVWTTYRFDKEENEKDFTDFFFDAELRLVDWMAIDFDGAYDSYESEVDTFNTQVGLFLAQDTRVALEYRYQKDRRDQVSGEFTLFPNARWSLTTYHRYGFEEGELEEQSYFVQHRSSCMGYGLGFRQVDEDLQFWFQIWLLAFPNTTIELGL